jgi:hypothetical protein
VRLATPDPRRHRREPDRPGKRLAASRAYHNRPLARREAAWLEASGIYRGDAYDGAAPAEDRARILAGIGDADAALDEIERLLAGPSWLSVHHLRLDPRWDPIRDDPRFQALLKKYDPPQPVR